MPSSSPPPVKIPFWAKWFYSDLSDLAENPLYLRWSGQRFIRRTKWLPRWISPWPNEFGMVWSIWGMRMIRLWLAIVLLPHFFILLGFAFAYIGWDLLMPVENVPFVSFTFHVLAFGFGIFISAYGFIWYLVLYQTSLMNFLGADGITRMACFDRRAHREHWATELCLAPMNPIEFDKATFIVLLHRELKTSTVCLSVVAIYLLILAISVGLFISSESFYLPAFSAYLAVGACLLIFAFAEAPFISAMKMSCILKRAAESVHLHALTRRRFENVFTDLTTALLVSYMPGMVMPTFIGLWFVLYRQIPSVDKSAFLFILSLAILLATSIPIQLRFIRKTLKASEGNLHKAFMKLARDQE